MRRYVALVTLLVFPVYADSLAPAKEQVCDGTGSCAGTTAVGSVRALKVDVVQTVGGAGGSGGSSVVAVDGGYVAVYGAAKGATTPLPVTGTSIDSDHNALDVKVQGTAAVSGTVAATQSGTWNVTNVSGTVSLPTGASTAAKQPAPGTAGSASADVITVQGIASMTALKTDSSATTQPVSGTVTANAGTGTFTVSGTVTTTPPSNASTNVTQLAGTAVDVNSGTKSAGTLRVVLATDQPALTNKILVTPDSVALPANQSVNVAQVAGTTTDTNSGVKSAGTIRVVIATDQPALTNKILVTPDSVALPANQSVNTAQFGGTNVSTGTGAGGAGIPRVTISNDSSLAANQSVNVAQINGVTPLTGSGATGTGSIRVTMATDSTGFATANGTIAAQSQLSSSRAVAYASSPTAVTAGNNAPAISDLEGRPYVNTGHPRTINCFVSTTATTSTQITGCEVVASNSIYITSVTLCGDIANATANAATLQSGTSTACTGPHILYACYHPALGCCTATFPTPIKATVAEGLCILDGVTGTKKAVVTGYVAP